VLSLGGITHGLIEGGATGFGAPAVVTALAVGAAALAAFVVVEARVAHPVLPLGLFRTRAVAVPVLVGFSLNIGFYGMVFLLSLYLQQQRGLSALATGLAFVPMTALTAVGNLAGSRASRPIPLRAKAVAGQPFMVGGLLVLCLAASVPVWLLVLLMIPVGVGGGSLAVPAVTALLLDNVPAGLAGTASGALGRTEPRPRTGRRPPTNGTSSSSCRPTASATTSPGAGSTCRSASCSRSRCWRPSAAATPRSGGTLRPTSGSATAARRCSAS
jgi:MFS transporter, DHA2 family, methylenomycin A resistance protein